MSDDAMSGGQLAVRAGQFVKSLMETIERPTNYERIFDGEGIYLLLARRLS